MQDRAEKTKAKILSIAEEEFSAMGYYGARIDAISEKAGVNKALIYKYFNSKEELYKTVLFSVYDRFSFEESELLAIQDMDYKEKIRRYVEMEFRYCFDNPNYVRMLMWENLNFAKYFKERELRNSKDTILQGVEGIVKAAHEKGTLDQHVDATQFLLTLYGLCFSYFTNMNTLSETIGINMHDREEMERRIEIVSNLLITFVDGGMR
ncbi:MAG: TetR family transcriptional regulator [Sphaerochaetaceae bacterium]|nr:TetR family transcriptional regulator [Sphaerochaetaceae bacterium]